MDGGADGAAGGAAAQAEPRPVLDGDAATEPLLGSASLTSGDSAEDHRAPLFESAIQTSGDSAEDHRAPLFESAIQTSGDSAEDHRAPVVLPRTLDCAGAEMLRDVLGAHLAAGRAIRLDGAAVDRLGTPGAQIILAAARAAESGGAGLRFTAASAELRAGFADLGLEQALLRATGGEWPSAF